MAANKFATMLHRNTHKMAMILVYTILEWTLIALLLLNALFSYLIAKFAAFFGLQPPCIFCSRVDHLFEPVRSYRDLLCHAHAAEVSRLGYCSHHRRLAEASDMCEDCSSSRPCETTDPTVALLSWMKRSEAGEKDLRCSCCDVILENGFYSPYLLLKPSWGVLEITQKGNLVEEGLEEVSEGLEGGEALDREGEKQGRVVSPDSGDTGVEGEGGKNEEQAEGGREMGALLSEHEQEGTALGQSPDTCVLVDDASLEVLTLRSEKILNVDERRLVPVELIDSATLTEKAVSSRPGREVDGELGHDLLERESTEQITATVEIMDMGSPQILQMVDIVKEHPSVPTAEESCGELGHDLLERESTEQITTIVEIMDMGSPQILQMIDIVEEHPSVPTAAESCGDCSTDHQCVVPEMICAIPRDSVDIEVEALGFAEDFDEVQGIASEDDSKAMDAEANCEISIGSEICDQEQIDQSHFHEQVSLSIQVPCSENYNETTDKYELIESEPVETIGRGVDHLSICPELDEVEEERASETPSSIEVIHALHKRFFYERREGTESLDGSVASEIEGSETLTIDRFKSALKAERKALSALYAELEEERSASAIAANQTMAMITRLQEEKAATQMEALQYQRMMDEQSEYDQEALQLLNELMMKREKEKQDLEKELEVYRKKVFLYEAKERRKIASKANGRSGTSSASSSAEDSDDLSFDYHEDDECFNSLNESNQNTPSDAVLNSGDLPEAAKHLITLDESLADFEEERLSIIEQLKALEEKLFTLDDEEPSNNLESREHFSEENGHVLNGDYEESGNDENGVVNGFSDDLDTNGKLHGERRSMVRRGKRLLPLFDAISIEDGDGLCAKQEETDASPESVSKFTIDNKKLAIAEEVDNVYERLQALEADREFLKHCISTLRKGDKGMDLLQEILQHLRDLRNVELQVRNAGDTLSSLSA